MTIAASGRTTGARLRRTACVVAAVVVVLVPMLVGLVLAWRAHPLLVVPAYLLGIPVWLTVVSGAWAVVRRVRPAREAPTAQEQVPDQDPVQDEAADVAPAAPTAPTLLLSSEIRLPAPRTEQAAAAGLRTPTP